ncbi:MAG: DNA polymerase III subunit gamma/tau [Clostridia bacterium]|nr:DNA polymerase III subunit gamma/tau [Clostridia bacterium]
MYQALYRKWRPQTFSDVCGQSHITTTLKNEIRTGRLSHAYLFTGSRGTGKTSCAKILAKAVNCLAHQDGDPCNECEVCRGIDDGTVLDITEIDAASNNGVDYIRSLREEVYYTPTAGKYRVYIIDEVHMLSIGAFNALLKTLEEPPEHVIFILATTEVHKVPATVLSRCQRFDFSRISDEAITARLAFVAKQEGLELAAEAAELIARLADGGMRDALSIFDRCIGNGAIDLARVNQIVGLAGNDRLHTLAASVAKGDIADVMAQLDGLHQNATDMARLCDQMIHHFRNLMLAKAVPNPGDLIVCSADDLRMYMNGAQAFSMEQILGVLNTLQTARERMRTVTNQRVELEMALIRVTTHTVASLQVQASPVQTGAPQPAPRVVPSVASKPEQPAVDVPWRTDDQEQKQIQKNEDIAQQYREELISPPSDEDCPPLPEETMPPTPAPVVAQSNTEPGGLPYFEPWLQVIGSLGVENRMMASVLKGSDAYLKGDIVLIKADNPQFIDLIRIPKNRDAVRDAIQTVTGKVYRLGPYKKEETAPKGDPMQAFLQGLQGKVTMHNLDEIAQKEEA